MVRRIFEEHVLFRGGAALIGIHGEGRPGILISAATIGLSVWSICCYLDGSVSFESLALTIQAWSENSEQVLEKGSINGSINFFP